MKQLLLACATALALTSNASAVDITGTYAAVSESHCVVGAVGSFNGSQQNLTGAAGISAASAMEFVTFSADGTGTSTFIATATYFDFSGGAQVGGWLDTANGTSTFTYTVTGDEYVRTFTSNVRTFTSGPRNGQTQTTTGEPASNGTISGNTPHVLLEYNTQPTVETWTFSNGNVANAFCSIHRTLTKVKETAPTN